MARATAFPDRAEVETVPAPGGELRVGLDVPLPAEVLVGRGTAIFVLGWCFSPQARIRSLSLVVDGHAQPVMAHEMPRLDVLEALHPGLDPDALAEIEIDPASAEDPQMLSYRSGFWGVAAVTSRKGARESELGLRAKLADGSFAVSDLGRVPIAALPDPLEVEAPEPSTGPFVAIAMATFEPPMNLFERQVESIRAQSHRNWVCVLSDDCSDPGRFAAMKEAVAGDERFVVSRSPRRRGFYENFERALSLVPAAANFVAMADQDDVWHADKLQTLLDAVGDAQLAYSDARIVGPDGELTSDTYWTARRNNYTRFLSLLVANSVTGAASLFPRRLLDLALPFPPAQFAHYHDHWVALTALAVGDIAYVDRPLYDYVQHAGAALGHVEATRVRALRTRIASLRSGLRERLRAWKMRYFFDACRLIQVATILEQRCGPAMAPEKRRVLERFLRTDKSIALPVDLWQRGAPELLGRTETLGAEMKLAYAFAWRRALAATAGNRPRRHLRLDAAPPANLAPKSMRSSPAAPGPREVVEKTSPLEFSVSDVAPTRVNVLIPTIDLEHFFGGYIAKLNLARRLAERGLRVRVLTIDRVPPLPRAWRREVEAYRGLAGLFDRVEVEFGRESGGVEIGRSDRFVASTWWSAYIAAEAMRLIGGGRFLYLIQEYEPFTYPMGTLAAMASESYRFPHRAFFSTELLREYFRRHRLGVYADGVAKGDAASASFENAITPVEPPVAAELKARRSRRLLFYARPEPHAARNMYDLGLLALGHAVQRGLIPPDWELHGIGTLTSTKRVDIGSGAALTLLRRSEQGEYAQLLRSYDVGLSLMYTPHPSLVPIEMASAGLVTVTNSFENKTSEAMAGISSNLVTTPPTIEGIAAGLGDAAARVEDFDGRVAGSDVRWSRSWDESFGDAQLDWVVAALES